MNELIEINIGNDPIEIELPGGARGLKGETGQTGATGPQGPQGEQGIQGPQGIQGEKGQDGISPIITTEQTTTGATITFTDAQGTNTVTLKNGEKGEKGDQGDRGLQGEQGIQGIQGEKGETGSQGPQGPQGTPFIIKKTYQSVAEMQADFNNMEENDYVMIASSVELEDNAKLYMRGSSQWIFISDFSGATGIQGEQGPQGIQGPQGEQGPQGIQGIQGPQGIQGEQGVQGYSIGSISKTSGTSAPGTTDTYTAYLNDAQETPVGTFNVYNGSEGCTIDDTATSETKTWSSVKINQQATITQKGTSITIDSINAPLKDFKLYGATEQDSYKGENLFNKDNTNVFDAAIMSNKITAIANNKTTYCECSSNTTYTISKIAGQRFKVALCSSPTEPTLNTSTGTAIQDNNASSITITTENNTTYLIIWFYNSNDSINSDIMLNSLMVEKGSTATNYEPYVGGKVSPNPDYPQEIKTVTGRQEIKVNGNNLLNTNDYTLGSWQAGGIPTSTSEVYRFNKPINVVEGETIYLSKHLVLVYDNSSVPQNVSGNLQITIPSGVSKAYFRIFASDTSNFNPSDYMVSRYKIVEYEEYKGRTYEINLGTSELCDNEYIYRQNSKWYKHKNYRKIELAIADLNGNDNYPTWNNVPYLNGDYPGNNSPAFPTNDLMSNIGGNNTTFGINTNSSNSMIFLNRGAWGLTASQWKEQYPNLIVILYYALPTPIEEEITDTELIAQLEAISTLLGTNNITVTSTGIVPEIEITAYTNSFNGKIEYLSYKNDNLSSSIGDISTVLETLVTVGGGE